MSKRKLEEEHRTGARGKKKKE